MVNQFKNLQQLMDFFKDEEVCKSYYEQYRWSGTPACVHCGSLKVYRTNRGFKCGEKECGKKFSVLVGTIFENTKISLRTWFAAMFMIATAKKGISSLQLHRQLGITQKTSWFLLSRIRTMLAESTNAQLEGEIEIDETYVGGKEKNKHKSKRLPKGTTGAVGKMPILGFLKRGGNVVMRVLKEDAATQENVQPIVKELVNKNATIITDGHGAYSGLNKHFSGHEIVKHDKDEYVSGKWDTNSLEGIWSIIKRGIYGIYHQVTKRHLHRYCNEFGFRYNNRNVKPFDIFELALLKVSSTRLTYNTLIVK